jgi:hypothetical protein
VAPDRSHFPVFAAGQSCPVHQDRSRRQAARGRIFKSVRISLDTLAANVILPASQGVRPQSVPPHEGLEETMRYSFWAGIVVCAVLSAGTARAQTLLGGPAPSALTFQPIDMKNVVVAAQMPTQQSKFNFANMFRRMTIPGLRQTGVSPLPSPSSFPTYANGKMVGTPPFQIGDPKAAKFQPVPPTTMTLP